jgi:hypothetical protein
MSKHGNANENDSLHHLYEIDDTVEDDVLSTGSLVSP